MGRVALVVLLIAKLVTRIQTEFVEVRLAPGTLDRREPTHQF